MDRIDLPRVPYTIVATVLALAYATGCGPTLRPTTQPEGLSSAAETSEAAAEAARSAEEAGDRVVLYASSTTGRQTGPPPGGKPDPEQPPPTAPDQPKPPAEGETPEQPEKPDQPDSPDAADQEGTTEPPSDTEPRAQTFVVERGDQKVTVLHGPHEQDRALGAFERAVETLQPPPAEKKSPYQTWSADWQPDRLELDEVALADGDRVELRGSAASEADVEEFVTRLNSLEAFSEVSIDETKAVIEGQGVTFRIAGQYSGS